MRHLLLSILLSVTTLTSPPLPHISDTLYCNTPTVTPTSTCWVEKEVYFA